MSFIARLAAARAADAAARKALADAHRHVEPNSLGLHKSLIEFSPVQYADALRKVADIMESIPALAAAAAEARAALRPLEDRACYKCNGSGNYNAPTRAYRQGRPYCFKCDGKGEGQ